MIGYSQNKSKLQEKINEYIENGSGDNVAFVEINELPQYKLCLLKRNIVANDDEIYEKVISQGTQYYKYYAITVDSEEKVYVANFSDAEQVITELKNKNSNNQDTLGIVEKYDVETKEITEVADCVTQLYEKKVVTVTYSSTAVAATGVNSSSKVIDLGISLIRPVSGTVTSRFGSRWGKTHKGLDIGAAKGTTIVAVASGTVTVAQYGYSGGYGNYVIISHGNGIQTLYGHCTSLLVSEGEYVSQGQAIATVGNTGNSQGNHLHLEIRINGVAQNPQNYLYSN
jgi:murein DD-endopeptidase MepM/ murein hydrolase activator NlpD